MNLFNLPVYASWENFIKFMGEFVYYTPKIIIYSNFFACMLTKIILSPKMCLLLERVSFVKIWRSLKYNSASLGCKEFCLAMLTGQRMCGWCFHTLRLAFKFVFRPHPCSPPQGNFLLHPIPTVSTGTHMNIENRQNFYIFFMLKASH